MDLVGLQHDDEAAGGRMACTGVLDLVELLVGAGAEHDVLRLAAVAPVTLQNRRAAVRHAVNFRAGGLAPSSVTIMASIEDEKPNIILLMTADTIKLNMIP